MPGDYFYWSGYVNAPYNTIYLRGKVTVTPRSSSVEEVVVRVGGPEAEHHVCKYTCLTCRQYHDSYRSVTRKSERKLTAHILK